MNWLWFICLEVLIISCPLTRGIEAGYELNLGILTLLKQVYQPMTNQEQLRILNETTFENMAMGINNSNNTWEVEQYHKKRLFLRKGQVFSLFIPDHRQQVDILRYALDSAYYPDKLYKLALWARTNINEDLFILAFTSAMFKYKIFGDFRFPPPYELKPHYFFHQDVIQKARDLKRSFNQNNSKSGEKILADYSTDLHDSVAYFVEDVGLNSYYYHSMLEFNELQYYHFHQQLLARYYLERLSNGLGKVSAFEWFEPFKSPYSPGLKYFNQVNFPERPSPVNLRKYYFDYAQRQLEKFSRSPYYVDVLAYEKMLKNVIESGHFKSEQMYYDTILNISLHNDKGIYYYLGRLINGEAEMANLKHFESIDLLYRKTLAFSHKNATEDIPATLEHLETSIRDPAFFNMYTKIMSYYKLLKSHIPPYSKKELTVPGILIKNVKVSKLTTFFEPFLSDITNCVTLTSEEIENNKFQVYAEQKRLNHEIFNYTVLFESQNDETLVISTFLGPKYNEHGKTFDLSESSEYFFRLDKFEFKATAGDNYLKRYSFDFDSFTTDWPTFNDIFYEIREALDNHHFHVKYTSADLKKFPERLMLPKGKESGQEFRFFVIIHPRKTDRFEFGNDFETPGYPFLREIRNESLWLNLPNAHFQDVKIFHDSSI